jgi:hypothetical protein
MIAADADGDDPMRVIAESSGLSVSDNDSYIEDAWKREKRKDVKLHILEHKKTRKIKGSASRARRPQTPRSSSPS